MPLDKTPGRLMKWSEELGALRGGGAIMVSVGPSHINPENATALLHFTHEICEQVVNSDRRVALADGRRDWALRNVEDTNA